MFNNFIGGGQVFLHKVRMLRQVLSTTIVVSLLAGCIITWSTTNTKHTKLDIDASLTYFKAKFALAVQPAISAIAIKKSLPSVNAYSGGKLWKQNMLASSVIIHHHFKSAWEAFVVTMKLLIIKSLVFGSLAGLFVFLLWSRFGKDLKTEKQKEGSSVVLTAKQVKKKLKSIGYASSLQLGRMPLVQGAETRHFLVTGSTGSGKTNLMHTLLPQIERQKQPSIVIDQTGEMIAKYYDAKRGDIIFNPFDARSKAWNFWKDCETKEELMRFSDILFSFNRKKHDHSSDPFWERSAQTVFNSCVNYLIKIDNKTLESLNYLSTDASLDYLSVKLKNTAAERFLTINNSITASSILATLSTSTNPMSYLQDDSKNGIFSLKEYFKGIHQGSNAWLFLATKPSNRELTLSIVSCLTDLALSILMDIGIHRDRRVWFVIDELPALGKLPALPKIMSEGRKYGACVIAGMQSLNQLYEHYGQFAGSSIFGQFGTSFFFRNTETSIAKMISGMCGSETITRNHQNTSFGANEFRDGVSYNEQQHKKPLIDIDHLANLAVGECYTVLPEPKVRISKMQIPESKIKNKNEGFIQK